MRIAYSAVDRFDDGFRCAYFFHYGDRPLALQILFRAMDDLNVQTIRLKNKLDASRKHAEKRASPPQIKKLSLSGSQLLQYLLFLESEEVERRQEASGDSTIRAEDLVIRYIKHAVTIAWRKPSIHMAVALWRVIHNYKVEHLRTVDEFFTEQQSVSYGDDCRRAKKDVMKSLQSRFGRHLELLALAGNEQRFRRMDWRPHRDFISQCLELLTPWDTPCLMGDDTAAFANGSPPYALRGRRQRVTEQEQVERNRIHSHVHPPCFARLAETNGLPDAGSMLDLPSFALCESSGPGGPPTRRRDLPHLDTDEISELKRKLVVQAGRRRANSPRLLRIHVDGDPCAEVNISHARSVQFPVNAGAELLKVYGQDSAGDVLLATHLLEYDEDGNLAAADAMVRIPGGKEITVSVSPGAADGVASVTVMYRVGIFSRIAAGALGVGRIQRWRIPAPSYGIDLPRFAFGCGAVVMICAAGWFALNRWDNLAQEERRLRAQLAESTSREQALQRSLENEQQRSADLQQQAAKSKGQRELAQTFSSVTAPSFILYPGIARGSEKGRSLAFPKDAAQITLKLHRSADSAGRHVLAALSVAGGAEIWNQELNELKQPSVVELHLPKNLLPPGYYMIKLSSIEQTGEPGSPDYYAFEVVRP
jgi:hypothetical protein